MKLPHTLAFLLLMLAGADAVEFRAYKATISLPFVSSTFETGTDKFVNVRMSNKQLINAALGQPPKTKVPKEVVLGTLIPSAATTPLPVRLVVLNTKTGVILRTVATVSASSVLVPTDPTKPVAALVSLDFLSLSSAAFATQPFSLRGSATGSAKTVGTSILLTAKLSGLHGGFTRTDAAAANYYAGVITGATLRVTGKPISTINL